ncbi:NADH dehydrogenase [Pullulanibacillus pueri]|uniref:NADH dehydrogenase-like protein YumB n=1 Tax=Pullulanibacillus pueri TaxID=1437324 RepID=A0A8J3EKE4_9BACL|nr:NAD(P)/FAD-dependent oxidoreductase [Pullulanibacillus pueri]MBM7680438.1 NADH dehydrogenase [Pullulanibacillus pueri]GGH75091.1 NADH dehydrogenase-like protein YumB [Pullulanibacillus pueri]
MNKPKILILGAGYGGMISATKLPKYLGKNEATITLVNKHNYHYQSTWLHEPAAGTLPADRARILIKDVIDTNRVEFIQDTVTLINKDENKVVLEKSGEIDYDYLIISLGFESATFGIKGMKENGLAIENLNSVRQIREHIEYQFSCYHCTEKKEDERLNIVVGGGGFTGVEFLGELANRIPELCKEYDIDRKLVRIINVEGSPSILPMFDKELVAYAISRLESKGVEFKFGYLIKECLGNKVIIEKKSTKETEEIMAGTVVWTGGVRGNHIVEDSGFDVVRGRVNVTNQLRVPGYDNIFVIGDCANTPDPNSDRPYPTTAQITIQQALYLSKNMPKVLNGEDYEPFVFNNMGTVASLGHGDAIGIIFGKTKLKGTSAAAMKKIIDDRYLLKLGGIGLVLKKGKLNLLSK